MYSWVHVETQTIRNVGETSFTTAQNPGKVIALKGFKQACTVPSAERRVLVTLRCTVDAQGYGILPMFVERCLCAVGWKRPSERYLMANESIWIRT